MPVENRPPHLHVLRRSDMMEVRVPQLLAPRKSVPKDRFIARELSMSIEVRPVLPELCRLIEGNEQLAPEFVLLLKRVERIRAGKEEASEDERGEMADQLERWRYEHLDKRVDTPAAGDARLVDELDLAAGELTRRGPRRPRCPRGAIHSTTQGKAAEMLGYLDPSLPVEELARRASELTRRHFARKGSQKQRILLYAPLYLSSYCTNHCAYCGFRQPEDIQRRHLSADEALAQADILQSHGFQHILLVAGDAPELTTTEYFTEIIGKLIVRGVHPAVEIAPQSTGSYAALGAAGVCGVTLYQETYNERLYTMYHPQGSKASYDWRLEGLERAAEAGIRRLGLGILLGLGDPREELPAMVRHAEYLQSRFPDCTIAFSLPRIHAAPKDFRPPYPVDDETFVRMYCALRLAFPEATLVLSTRESAALRSRLVDICITQLSAGSSTQPGGYAIDEEPCGEQFPVTDDRTPEEVADWLRKAGFTVAWNME